MRACRCAARWVQLGTSRTPPFSSLLTRRISLPALRCQSTAAPSSISIELLGALAGDELRIVSAAPVSEQKLSVKRRALRYKQRSPRADGVHVALKTSTIRKNEPHRPAFRLARSIVVTRSKASKVAVMLPHRGIVCKRRLFWLFVLTPTDYTSLGQIETPSRKDGGHEERRP